MDKTAEITDTSTSKKRPTPLRSKPIKTYKSFLSQAGKIPLKSKVQKKTIQKPEITPLKARLSLYKENSTTKDSESNSNAFRSKISRQSTIKKKNLKQIKLKNRAKRGKSLGETGKKNGFKDQRSNSRPSLKAQVSVSTLKVLDMNKKMTPRSSHPSPQHSHRTPDSIRISQGQNLPNLTEKKTKIPEVGYYCKRFYLFDKNKPLYKDSIDLSIEKQDFPKLSFDNPFTFPSDHSITGKSIQSIPSSQSIKSDQSIQTPQSLHSKSPLQLFPVPCDATPVTPATSIPPATLTSTSTSTTPAAPTTTTAAPNPSAPNPTYPEPPSIPQCSSSQSFESPTRLIQVFSSPDSKFIKRPFGKSPKTPKTPKSSKTFKSPPTPGRNVEPRAPRKTAGDFDSPGSFIFSLSSNSSEEKFNQDWSLPDKMSIERKTFQRDEESQTDLIEFVADSQVMEGLKLIGRLSEIMNKGKNLE